MKILFYLHQYPAFGGIETITSLWADYFSKKGHTIVIVSNRVRTASGFNADVDSRVTHFVMPDDKVSKRNRMFLQKLIQEFKIGVVVFQDSYARIEDNLFPVNTNLEIRVVTVEHSSPYREITRKKGRLSLRELLGRLKFPLHKVLIAHQDATRRIFLYNNSDYYVLLSSRFLGEFRAITGLKDLRKLRFIPNATRPPTYASDRELAVKEKTIVFVGSLVDAKGCRYLLDAWRRIASDLPDWRLRIIGDGPLRSELEAQASGLVGVTFEGYRTDVFEVFKKASIFAFPSIREGWGLVLVEAMSQGCVPICFNSYSAVYDIVDDGVNGFIVPTFDVEDYSKRLLELIQNPDKRQNLSRAAEVRARMFHPDLIAARWEEIFGIPRLGV